MERLVNVPSTSMGHGGSPGRNLRRSRSDFLVVPEASGTAWLTIDRPNTYRAALFQVAKVRLPSEARFVAQRIRGSGSLIRVARAAVEARFRDALAFLGASDLGTPPGSLRGGVATSMLLHQCDISTARHQLRHTPMKRAPSDTSTRQWLSFGWLQNETPECGATRTCLPR